MDMLSERWRVYFVGGYVRDVLVGASEEVDQDILVVGATPRELLDVLSRFGKAELVGKSFGVIKFRRGGRTYDFSVPSLRTPTGSVPAPNMSLEEDLRQRDFTVNAIAYDILNRALVDPTGGLRDIERRLLKQTSPSAFQSDPIRVLRLCRLKAKLGFDVDAETSASARRFAKRLSDVAKERIGEEFRKIMLLSKPSSALRCLLEVGALDVVLPELAACVGVTQPGGMHAFDVFDHILRTVDESPPKPLVRFAALFHDITKPAHRFVGEDGRARFYGHQTTAAKLAKDWLEEHAFSKRFASAVAQLVKHHMFTHATTEKGIRRFIRRVGEELVEPLFELRFADTKAQGLGGDIDAEMEYCRRVRSVLEQKPPLSVRDLAVDGYDVMNVLGIPPGPDVGKALGKLLAAVIDDPTLNEREKLLEMLRSMKPND